MPEPSLTNPAAGGGGGGQDEPTWRDDLPEDLRGDPSLATVPDVETLAKNYVATKKLVGQDRMPVPQENWGDEQWNEFYKKAGRPETEAEYAVPEDLKLPEGVKLDEGEMGKARKAFHKLGLTKKQGAELLRVYADNVSTQHAAVTEGRTKAFNDGMEKLKTQHGDKTSMLLEVAQATIKKYGGDALISYLDQSGLGNNVELINAFVTIGKKEMEHRGPRGEPGVVLSTAASAKAEIEKIKMDPELSKALIERNHPNHKAVAARFLELQKMAAAKE